jgi:hypothetical protein
MKRKILHILLIVAAYSVLTSKSCGPELDYKAAERSLAEKDSMMGQLREEFKSAYLLDDNLWAYHEKAGQKLFDLADYLTLYADKDMDTLFRNHAKAMISRLFYSADAVVQLPLSINQPENKACHLTSLLEYIDKAEYESIRFDITGLATIKPFGLEDSEHYTGLLGCNFTITGIADNDTMLLGQADARVRIITALTSKRFGAEESLRIWQVYLSDIVPVNQYEPEIQTD